MLPRLYSRWIHTHTHTHAYIDTQSLYILMALTFLSFFSSISFYFILFWVSFGSQLFVYLAVSSHFIFFNFFPVSLLLLQTNHFEGDYPVRKKAGAKKKEYRMKNSVTSLPLLHSVYFVPGLSLSLFPLFIYIYFFLFLSLLYVFPSAFLSLSFLLLCKKYIYLYIWLIPSSLHTDTTHNYSSQWLVIISKATQLPLFLTGPFALVEWNGS